MAIYTRKSWSREEDQFLADSAGVMTILDVASALGRTYDSVQNRARMLNVELVKNRKGKSVSQEEIDFIVENGDTMSANELSRALSRPAPTIKMLARRNGIELRERSHNEWTDDKLAELERLVKAGYYYDDIAKRLGFTRAAISLKVSRLGLTNGLHGTRRSHRPWGTDETSELVRMYERGDSVSDISAKLARSERSIKGKVYSLRLSRPSIE